MQEFWQQCLDSLKKLVQSAPKIYDTWFKVISPVFWDPETGVLTLEAPASKVRFIRSAYLKNIQTIATHVNAGKAVTVSLVPAKGQGTDPSAEPGPGPAVPADQRRREETGLLPGLTFENYVNGNANQLAVGSEGDVVEA